MLTFVIKLTQMRMLIDNINSQKLMKVISRLISSTKIFFIVICFFLLICYDSQRSPVLEKHKMSAKH